MVYKRSKFIRMKIGDKVKIEEFGPDAIGNISDIIYEHVRGKTYIEVELEKPIKKLRCPASMFDYAL